MEDSELEELFGPAARHSEHGRGERIAFVEGDKTYTGTIIWVCAPGDVAGKELPTTYIVEGDQQVGFPHIVLPGDILESR